MLALKIPSDLFTISVVNISQSVSVTPFGYSLGFSFTSLTNSFVNFSTNSFFTEPCS